MSLSCQASDSVVVGRTGDLRIGRTFSLSSHLRESFSSIVVSRDGHGVVVNPALSIVHIVELPAVSETTCPLSATVSQNSSGCATSTSASGDSLMVERSTVARGEDFFDFGRKTCLIELKNLFVLLGTSSPDDDNDDDRFFRIFCFLAIDPCSSIFSIVRRRFPVSSITSFPSESFTSHLS